MSPRLLPYSLCVVVTLAMLSPVLRRPPVDGFPLSTYPMFAQAEPTIVELQTVLGITPDGDAEVLTPRLISGDRWSGLASKVLYEAARSRSKRRALCEAVAKRVAADPDRASRYVELEFVAEVYDTATYFRGQAEAQSRKLLASCPVSR